MASSTSASPPPFTFASPIPFSSESHEDAVDFDYQSWIQQSKIANCYSSDNNNKRLWMDDADAEVINRHHQEMMHRVADNLPEEAYELSLRDITELSLPPPHPPHPPTRATTTRSLPCRHKSTPSISTERAGSFIIKLFMPSPSRASCGGGGGGGRNKSFSSSSSVSGRNTSASANHGRSPPSMENDTHSNGYHGSTKRKPMSCYPFFSSSKYKAKQKFITGNQ